MTVTAARINGLRIATIPTVGPLGNYPLETGESSGDIANYAFTLGATQRYGGVFDGAHPTEDTIAITKAIAAIAAQGGGEVLLQPGSGTVTVGFLVPQYVGIRGSGQSATTITKTTTTTITGVSNGIAKDCIFYYDGPSAGNFAFGCRGSGFTLSSASSASNSCGIYFGNVARSQFENIGVYGFYSAVAAGSCFVLSLKNVHGGSNYGPSFNFAETQLAGSGTVTATAGAATFSVSQAGVIANGSTVVVGVTSYVVSAFNGTTGCTLSGAPTFSAGAFTYSGVFEKTSISLENCYSEASAGGFWFDHCKYSSMRSCAVDYCNSGGSPSNPYGGSAKGTYTALSYCYKFVSSTVAMDGCGAERAFADFAMAQTGSFVTMNGCYVATHSLSYTGSDPSAFISIQNDDATDSRITITGCGFGNGGVTKTGSGTNIHGYYVSTANTVAQIIADQIDTVGGSGLVAQTTGRVYSIAPVLRGTLPTMQTSGVAYSASNSLSQATGVATTHYTITAPGIYEVAAYGGGGVNYVADATVALSSTGVLTLLRTNSSSGLFVISVSGATVKVTQSNGTTVAVVSTLLNRLLA